MRFLPPSIDDIRTWGRCFSLYPGATATGASERSMKLRADGGLIAVIPLQGADHAKKLCETSGLISTIGDSDRRPIDEFQAFRLGLTGYKFETSFRGPVKWFTNCNLQRLDDDRVLSVLSAEAHLGSSITSSIEEVSLLVDKATVYELLSVPHEGVFAPAASQFD